MARRRAVEASVAYDEQFNALSEFAQLLYLRILPHTDDFGRFEGSPRTIRARACPTTTRSDTEIEEAVSEIMKAGLIGAYLSGRRIILQYKTHSFQRINAVYIKNSTVKTEYPEPEEEGSWLTAQAYLEHVRDTCLPSVDHVFGTWSPRAIVSSKQKAVSSKKKVEHLKKAFGKFDNVLLTETEHAKLVTELGSEKAVQEGIDILSSYKESSGKKYKSDYAAFHTWVRKELEKRKNGTVGKYEGADQIRNILGGRT